MKLARFFACARCVLQGAMMSCLGRLRPSIVSLILTAGLCGATGRASSVFAGDDLRSEEVRARIDRGVDFLRSQQAADGSFLCKLTAGTGRVTRQVTRTVN